MQEALQVRKTGNNQWTVIHLPTGKAIPASQKEVPMSYGSNKKRDVVAFYNRIKDAYPWHEFTSLDNTPSWFSEAYNFVRFGNKEGI